MQFWRHGVVGLALLTAVLFGSGCTTSVVLLHLHDKLTEGDPLPCARLNSVERALQARCGPPEPSGLTTRDVLAEGMAECSLTMAARDPQFWPVLPELLAHGAVPERCTRPPLVALAQAEHVCPRLALATPRELEVIRWLARADARSVHHDVVRVLSCPQARAAGIDKLLDEWQAAGQLPVRQLQFNPLSALHPSHLGSALAARLEAQGHDTRSAIGVYDGRLPSGFELALQTGDHAGLDWWLTRAPGLANRVPPSHGANLPWRPLARMLSPSFVADAAQQRGTVEFLLARGADPWLHLPQDPRRSIVGLAREMNSPLLPLLNPPRRPEAALAQGLALVREN